MRSCAVCSLLGFFLTPKGSPAAAGETLNSENRRAAAVGCNGWFAGDPCCRGTHTDESHFSEESKPPQSESYRAARITASIIDLCEAARLFPVTVVELPIGAEDFAPAGSDSAEWFDLLTPVGNE